MPEPTQVECTSSDGRAESTTKSDTADELVRTILNSLQSPQMETVIYDQPEDLQVPSLLDDRLISQLIPYENQATLVIRAQDLKIAAKMKSTLTEVGEIKLEDKSQVTAQLKQIGFFNFEKLKAKLISESPV